MNNNRTVLDLRKVQHGTFFYRNQDGVISVHKPPAPTMHGMRIDAAMALPHPDYPGETTLERAKRLGLIDTWTSTVVFRLAANHDVTYTGKKAVAMWREWNRRIFGKQQKEKGKQ